MMNLCFSKALIIEITSLIKHIRCLHYMKNYRNVLVPFKSTNTQINSYNFLLKLNNGNNFSTANSMLKSKDRFKEKKKIVHFDVNEISEVVKVQHMTTQLDEAIENYKEQLTKNVSVRTRLGAIEELTVTFEDEEYNLEELVDISRKPNMVILNVSAFPQLIPNILDVLGKSSMNLNPQQDSTTIYISLPKVTKEHREDLAKTAKQYFVKCKDAISSVRNEHYKHLKKNTSAAMDLIFKAESYINAVQKEYVNTAEKLLKAKQKELLGES